MVNKYLAHLTWERVTDEEFVMVPMTFLAHETSWGMSQFIDEAVRREIPQARQFSLGRDLVRELLPPFENRPQTLLEPAPPRKQSR